MQNVVPSSSKVQRKMLAFVHGLSYATELFSVALRLEQISIFDSIRITTSFSVNEPDGANKGKTFPAYSWVKLKDQ